MKNEAMIVVIFRARESFVIDHGLENFLSVERVLIELLLLTSTGSRS